MKASWILGLGIALICAGVPAYAFQEQTVGSGAVAPAPQAGEPAAKAVPGAEAQMAPAEAAKPVEGTEVRIPGLGRLGVLPKMDFGLELLYGANENGKAQSADPDTESNADELRIRGSVKHNF